jgi:hypothetical protein
MRKFGGPNSAVIGAAAGLLLVSYAVPGLMRVVYGGGPGERSLYMKLPLEQPRFHWQFADREALLAGSLEIAIHGADGRDTVLTVFRDGAWAPGWRAIESSRGVGEIYFGFVGDVGVRTHPKDSVVVRLRAVEDLDGIGAHRRGVLPTGEYQASASYSNLIGHPLIPLFPTGRSPVAYIGCWRETWDLDVTEEAGWRGALSEDRPFVLATRLSSVFDNAFERGTDGDRCAKR